MCPKLGNCLFQIQGVSELLWCIKLSYFAENRWCPNINGVRKYMVNTVYSSSKLRTAQMMIFSLVAMIGLEKCCITSAYLQWLCHKGERDLACGALV